jgi:hypothetical protein
MELNFREEKGVYVAEFEATADFNLHIEREEKGSIAVYQRTTPSSEYDSIYMGGYFNRDHKTFDADFVGAIYPKYIKVVSSAEVVTAELTLKA